MPSHTRSSNQRVTPAKNSQVSFTVARTTGTVKTQVASMPAVTACRPDAVGIRLHGIRSNAKLRPSGCLLACPAVGHLPACRPVRLHLRLQTFCQGGLGRGLHCGQYRALCTWQCNRLFGGPVSSATVLL